MQHPGALLSCLDFDGTREGEARKRMRVVEGSRVRIGGAGVCGVSLQVDVLVMEEDRAEPCKS